MFTQVYIVDNKIHYNVTLRYFVHRLVEECTWQLDYFFDHESTCLFLYWYTDK